MKILIVDDEKLIREVIKEYCTYEGYEVLESSDGLIALDMIKKNKIDLIILDIMMPKLDGFSVCKKIKEIKNIPIIMLSARIEEYDKLFGFELGIDDYITKPFSPKELIARIKAITKRGNMQCETFVYKQLSINFTSYSVYIDNEEIKMTPKEYELLFYFIKNQNIAISREKLLTEIWGYDFCGDDRTVDTHIKMLRNSLQEYRNLIITVRGMGYKFEVKEK